MTEEDLMSGEAMQVIYHAGQLLTRDTASDRPEIRVEVAGTDRLTISAVDYPLAPWWSVPRGRLLGTWREVPHPPVMIDNYEKEQPMATSVKIPESVDKAWCDANIAYDQVPEFRKKVLTRAIRMGGPFTVETSEGPLTCADGWLCFDARDYPYPVAADEFALIYGPAVNR